MLYKFDKKYETISHILMRPQRDCRLIPFWKALQGDGVDPCRPYGEGVLQYVRQGDLAPYFEKANTFRFLRTRLPEGSEGAWGDSPAEEARQALIAAHNANDGDGDPALVEEYLYEWLELLSQIEPVEGYKNRLFPRTWRADRGLTRLSMAERSLQNMVGENGWSWANWNALNFWHLPRPEEITASSALQAALNSSITSEGRSTLAPAIERSRSRACLWLNSTDFHGTQSTTPDLYGSATGSVTVEFWINPREMTDHAGVGSILHVPGLMTIALLPHVDANPAFDDAALDGKQTYKLAVISEQAVRSWMSGSPSLLDPPISNPSMSMHPDVLTRFIEDSGSNSSASFDNGFVTSAPDIRRGRWSRCVMRFDAARKTLDVSINSQISLSISTIASGSNSLPNDMAWWEKGTTTAELTKLPEYICIGGRPALSESEMTGNDPVVHPTEGEWSFNVEQDFSYEPQITYGDPLLAEVHKIRIWGTTLSNAVLEDRDEAFASDDPLRRFLLFDLPLTFRPDSPDRPRATLSDWFEVRQEDLPCNYVWAGERGDVISNVDGYLFDEAGENWGLGVGSFSERFIVPDTSAWGGAGLESSDLVMSQFGQRNSLIAPCDNPSIRPAREIVRDAWGINESLRSHEDPTLNLSAARLRPALDEFVSGEFDNMRTPSQHRDHNSRASSFLELQGIFYGERIDTEEFVWESHFALEWLLTCLQSQAPLETIEVGPLLEGVKFDPNPAEASVYVDLLRDEPTLSRSCFRVVALPDDSLPYSPLIRSQVPLDERESIEEERDTKGMRQAGYSGRSFQVGCLDTVNGLAALHHPAFWRFGEKTLRVAFKGQRNMWVREWILPVERGWLRSRNPSWIPAFSSFDDLPQNTTLPLLGAENTVGITEAVLFDRNLNALLKIKTAQPIYKQGADNMAFKGKLDF